MDYDSRDNLITELRLLEELKQIYLVRAKLPGLIFIPEELTVSIGEEERENLAEEISEALVMVSQSSDSVGNIVPIIVQGPLDLIAQIKHIKFDDNLSELLEKVDERIEKVKTRLKQFDDLAKDAIE